MYISNILIDGNNFINLKKTIAIVVEKEGDVAAFKNFSLGASGASTTPTQAPAPPATPPASPSAAPTPKQVFLFIQFHLIE